MTTSNTIPRRRVLRPPQSSTVDARRLRKLTRQRAQLASEQQSLVRWMTKLKRAFHAVEKQQKSIARLEREIARLEQR